MYENIDWENFTNNGDLTNLLTVEEIAEISDATAYYATYEDGKIQSRDSYNLHMTYYPNGQIEAIDRYENRRLHGIALEFNENGKIKTIKPFRKSRYHGLVQSFNENGQLTHEAVYDNDHRRDSWKKISQNCTNP